MRNRILCVLVCSLLVGVGVGGSAAARDVEDDIQDDIRRRKDSCYGICNRQENVRLEVECSKIRAEKAREQCEKDAEDAARRCREECDRQIGGGKQMQ